jgi:hypothetical protein
MEIVILGMAPSRELCNFKELHDRGAIIYSCNNGYKQIALMHGYMNKIFLAHAQTYHIGEKEPIFNWEDFNNLMGWGVEVYSTHRIKKLKAKAYPVKPICKKFNTNYISSTISYMLAYALHDSTEWCKDRILGKRLRLKEPLKLYLYGVDMLEGRGGEMGEYSLEKGGVEFWLGIAKGLGAEIINDSPTSEVLKTWSRKMYGEKFYNLNDVDPLGLMKRKTEITDEECFKKLAKMGVS